MNTHVLDPRTDQELRSLDAAATVTGDPARRAATLTAILASPAERDALEPPPAPRRARRRDRQRDRRPARRWAAAGTVAAAVTLAAVLVPTLTPAPSYASWTSRPGIVTAAESDRVREACLDQQGSSIGDGAVSTRGLRVALAERRGDFVTVLLTKEYGQQMSASVHCLARLPVGASEVTHVDTGASAGGGLAAPTGRQFTQGSMAQLGGHSPVSMTEGDAGPDVVGITLHADGHDVVATVADGRYAAWWPGRAFSGADDPSGQDGSEPSITYDVTYVDGTVERDVPPATP